MKAGGTSLLEALLALALLGIALAGIGPLAAACARVREEARARGEATWLILERLEELRAAVLSPGACQAAPASGAELRSIRGQPHRIEWVIAATELAPPGAPEVLHIGVSAQRLDAARRILRTFAFVSCGSP